MNEIKVVRIYDHEQPAGYRILVDRLWPRGISKIKAHLDEWDKEIGPTNELRKWFNHEDNKDVKEKLAKENVLFLYGAKNKKYNQAVVLKEFIDQQLS